MTRVRGVGGICEAVGTDSASIGGRMSDIIGFGFCMICRRPIAHGEGYRLGAGEAHVECGELSLFEIPPSQPPEPLARLGAIPLWTEHKARLIERYLYYFVLVTKHGTYIDGFAGPQEPDHPEMWSAKLVLESQPRWFRHFYLFDDDPGQAARPSSLHPTRLGMSRGGQLMFTRATSTPGSTSSSRGVPYPRRRRRSVCSISGRSNASGPRSMPLLVISMRATK